MAIYHFSAKVISRASGSSAVASAAYRSAERLHDQRLDRHHDFTNKSGVVHSEIMLPQGAAERLGDRSTLWNEVEAVEVRKDAQLAREVEFAIPREMTQQQGIALARDFVQREFVDRGMIADLNVHWDVGADGLSKPHAHVMLTMRTVDDDGFGAKERDWNRTDLLQDWRERWEGHVNERLAALDIDVRIDHRSLEAQGIDLEPQNKIGAAASRRLEQGLDAERAEEHRAIARANGEKLLAHPEIALDAITHNQATFTSRDLAKFVHRHSDDKEQFDAVMREVKTSPELVMLGKDGRGEDRFTSRDMIAVEARLDRASDMMAGRRQHRVPERMKEHALQSAQARGLSLSDEQRTAFNRITDGRDLANVVGYAGTGKSAMLGVAREAWEQGGYTVRGIALSGIAAENLEAGSAIPSRTIASIEHGWAQERDLLTSRDVLVIDEAGMIGSRQLERVLSHAESAGAKVVMVGDPEQLQAIEAGAAFRSLAERHGAMEITDIRRQLEDWQRDATRHLATGRTASAIQAYAERDMVHAAETRELAREGLIDTWDRERIAAPDQSRMILTHTNAEVRDLNELARDRLREAGNLGENVKIKAERGDRDFATGDRIMFLKNDRGLGVKNGSLGAVEKVAPDRMTVRLDSGPSISFDTKDYAHVDHGYAATIHKSQGVTVDRTHVLATPGLDCHSAYVALSRHRDGVQLHYGRDDFTDTGKLVRTLSRERAKDMASDYAPEKAFQQRRGIDAPEREIAAPAPQRARGIFDGFNPKPFISESIAPTHQAAPAAHLGRAVERYARAITEAQHTRERGVSLLPHQRAAISKSFGALDLAKPGAAMNARDAFEHQPGLVSEAANGRTATTIRAMQLEAEIKTNPAMRADRFVERWQSLHRQKLQLDRSGDVAGAKRITEHMAGYAKGLERDPQIESLLRNRTRELGIGGSSGSNLSHDLADSLGLRRVRDLGISM
ncbi:MAG: Ti-type conjugative transfer relaxase TraA [Sphingobium sp.]